MGMTIPWGNKLSTWRQIVFTQLTVESNEIVDKCSKNKGHLYSSKCVKGSALKASLLESNI